MPIKNVEGRAAGIWPSCSTRASLRSSAWSLNDGSTDPPSMAGHRFVSPRKGPHGRPHYMDAVDAGPRSPPPFANGLRFMERTSQQPPHQGAGAVATTERGRFSRRSPPDEASPHCRRHALACIHCAPAGSARSSTGTSIAITSSHHALSAEPRHDETWPRSTPRGTPRWKG